MESLIWERKKEEVRAKVVIFNFSHKSHWVIWFLAAASTHYGKKAAQKCVNKIYQMIQSVKK